jgi:hypothetical protein
LARKIRILGEKNSNSWREKFEFFRGLGGLGLDSKNFWGTDFLSFLEWNFGFEFADPRGILENPANYS